MHYFFIDNYNNNYCVFMQNGDQVSYEVKHFPVNVPAESVHILHVLSMLFFVIVVVI